MNETDWNDDLVVVVPVVVIDRCMNKNRSRDLIVLYRIAIERVAPSLV